VLLGKSNNGLGLSSPPARRARAVSASHWCDNGFFRIFQSIERRARRDKVPCPRRRATCGLPMSRHRRSGGGRRKNATRSESRWRRLETRSERAGFEPAVQALYPYAGLANRCFKPLSHLSRMPVSQSAACPPVASPILACPLLANVPTGIRRAPSTGRDLNWAIQRLAIQRLGNTETGRYRTRTCDLTGVIRAL
jgi:hypothetical protein